MLKGRSHMLTIEAGKMYKSRSEEIWHVILTTVPLGCHPIAAQNESDQEVHLFCANGHFIDELDEDENDLIKEHIPQPRMADESLLPGWANFGYCMQVNGYWYSYPEKPELLNHSWWSGNGVFQVCIPRKHEPQNIPDGFDFRDSWVEVQG